MDDFRNEYRERKKGNGWVILLTILSAASLIVSSVALFRANQIQNGHSGTVPEITMNKTDNTTGEGGTVSGDGVAPVVSQMKGKVASVVVYGKTSNSKLGKIEYAAVASGSGFVVNEQGYVVTNNHVISNGEKFKVQLSDNSEYDAELVGSDVYSDLAVLKIQGGGTFSAVAMGDSGQVQVGQVAIAIGSPLGTSLNNSVTVGYISAVDREVSINGNVMKMIQTDAAINPGNSGGPLLNAQGQVIGINTLKSTFAGYDSEGNSISADGIGFAIPSSDALPIINSLIQKGKYERPGIGITVYAIDGEVSSRAGVPQGLLIRSVYDGSPAKEAGLAVNDIITKIDGQELKENAQLTTYCNTKKIGDEVTLTVVRDNKTLDIKVKLGDINSFSKNNTSNQDNSSGENNGHQWTWPFE